MACLLIGYNAIIFLINLHSNGLSFDWRWSKELFDHS